MNEMNKIWYGGDYNPEQWEESIYDVDFELFEKANINILTLPVFSWAKLQKPDESYDFEWLEEIIERAEKKDISICLATSTAVQPAWLSKKYPEILPVDAHGSQKRFGGRVKFCPNSKMYKLYARKLVEQMAKIAKKHQNIVAWHIGNEYDNYCYCDHCLQEFRNWVKRKYGSVEAVNKAWNLYFWGHEIYDFDEIEIPDFRTEGWELNGLERTNFQTISLDYKRFMNESVLSCYQNELEIIRELTPNIPVTTNFMGMFKPLNYFSWAKHLDFISWDHYPGLKDPVSKSAMLHDLMRSLKKESPFWLMEQSPSQQNWAPYNTLKRPGELRMQSLQTIARGADAIMYFQMRRSIANCEKFHGALIDHIGTSETRVYKECQEIGADLKKITPLIGSLVKARVAIFFDWENWWGIDLSSGPSVDLNYVDFVERIHKSIYRNGEMVDFINYEDDFSKYDVIYAPMLYMVKTAYKSTFEEYVKNGGTLILTTFSGIVDEQDHVTRNGYPGVFREMAGIWVEEIDGILPEMKNKIQGAFGQEYKSEILCDVIHTEGAEVLGTYGEDFYKDTPVFTKNKFGKGSVYYIGTIPEQSFLDDFADKLFEGDSIPEGVEKSVRINENETFEIYLNFNSKDCEIQKVGSYVDILSGNTYENSVIIRQRDAIILKKR